MRHPTGVPRRLVVGFAIAAGLWIGVFIYALLLLPRIALGDFITYHAGVLRLLAGQPLYATFQLAGPYSLGDAAFGQGYVYPPSAAILSAPLGLMPLELASLTFSVLSALALASVVYLIPRRDGASRTAAAAITLLVVGSGPGVWSIGTGNINTLVAAAIGMMWLAPRSAGYLAAVGALVKLYPGMGIVWVVRKRGGLAGPTAVGAIGFAACLVAVGVAPWLQFVSALALGRGSALFVPAPRSLLTAFVGDSAAQIAVVLLTLLALVAVIRIRDDRRAFAMLSVAVILPAPEWFAHLALVPMVGVLPLLVRMAIQAAPGVVLDQGVIATQSPARSIPQSNRR
ncbi:MAG: DUF2029 domain-containing protein [Chloroflexi bacterium]|nr:MAG: DUF2029 domain-containing protein [Chloroflexota bacterium]